MMAWHHVHAAATISFMLHRIQQQATCKAAVMHMTGHAQLQSVSSPGVVGSAGTMNWYPGCLGYRCTFMPDDQFYKCGPHAL